MRTLIGLLLAAAMMGELLERVMGRLELAPKQRKQVGPTIRADELPAFTAGGVSK
jgi:hypothetical protein